MSSFLFAATLCIGDLLLHALMGSMSVSIQSIQAKVTVKSKFAVDITGGVLMKQIVDFFVSSINSNVDIDLNISQSCSPNTVSSSGMLPLFVIFLLCILIFLITVVEKQADDKKIIWLESIFGNTCCSCSVLYQKTDIKSTKIHFDYCNLHAKLNCD